MVVTTVAAAEAAAALNSCNAAAVQKILVKDTPPLQQIGGDVNDLTIIVTGPTR
jgi:hypothetical protein